MRSFIAIDLPGAIRAALAAEQGRLRAACGPGRAIRWTRPEGLHLTLKFLGEVAVERLPEVTAALESLGAFEPFEVEVGGFGFFPSARRPRVFWVGLDAPPALAGLAARVEAAMASVGFAPEGRPFRPHLTLARFEDQESQPALETALENGAARRFGRFPVDTFFLFESKLKPGGAEHSKRARFPVLPVLGAFRQAPPAPGAGP
jgi:RNA 2',3'-cyclic 3'-phosphodiesterase